MLDNRNLRDLIRRWRATPQSTAALFGEAADAIRATIAAKERVLYPAVRAADPQRGANIDAAIAQSRRIEGFLTSAEQLGPNSSGFQDEAQDAASAMDGLIVHEQRDILPGLDHLSQDDRDHIDDNYRTAWVAASTKLTAAHTSHTPRIDPADTGH
ncbi:hemerythrin domain-containing protein [Embleya sp. NBC_00896]|uniref:hemerythrin domain-containing protein n=1 Tax=Embleya sp. NBC_00896 TaxID=2975961 RepID=UPI002F90F490|nr:hemerythrin domain-containing protein [Embleya sp. NBC_00896]